MHEHTVGLEGQWVAQSPLYWTVEQSSGWRELEADTRKDKAKEVISTQATHWGRREKMAV